MVVGGLVLKGREENERIVLGDGFVEVVKLLDNGEVWYSMEYGGEYGELYEFNGLSSIEEGKKMLEMANLMEVKSLRVYELKEKMVEDGFPRLKYLEVLEYVESGSIEGINVTVSGKSNSDESGYLMENLETFLERVALDEEYYYYGIKLVKEINF